MPYLKVPLNFFTDDHRLRVLTARLGSDSATKVFVRLWNLAGTEAPRDGRLSAHSADTLRLALGYKGKSADLEKALIEAGWLEKEEKGYRLLYWERDQGHIWRLQQRNASNIKSRWKKRFLMV